MSEADRTNFHAAKDKKMTKVEADAIVHLESLFTGDLPKRTDKPANERDIYELRKTIAAAALHITRYLKEN